LAAINYESLIELVKIVVITARTGLWAGPTIWIRLRSMNVLIYGGGAVGLGIASCLLKSGVDVDILARRETVILLKQHGLLRDGIFGEYNVLPEKYYTYEHISAIEHRKYHYICICIKSFDSESAAYDIAQHREILDTDGRIVLFQNGWGNTEKFLKHFNRDYIYNARVITGFKRQEPNRVTITVHADAIHIGHLFCQEHLRYIEPLVTAINDGDIPCYAVDCIAKDLWAKMLYNCPLNSLGAIFGVPYGKLGDYGETRVIMNMIIGEVFQVMRAEGYCTHWDSPEGFIETFYTKLIPLTKEHESSTLQDINAGKRTEIDALNGAVVLLGKKHRIAVPANTMVYNMVKYIAAINQK
jgi:2-dehydropantoate 2-reductase